MTWHQRTDSSQRFFVPGPLPGLNDFVRKHYRVYSALKWKWTEIIRLHALAHSLKPFGRAFFAYEWFEENMKRDPSNIAAGGRKLIEDALQPKWMTGDGWKGVAGFYDKFTVVPGIQPGVEVIITEAP